MPTMLNVPLSVHLVVPLHYIKQVRVQRVAAAQLRLLVVLAFQLITNRIEQLDVALLRILLERRNESIRHGTSRLTADVGVGSVGHS